MALCAGGAGRLAKGLQGSISRCTREVQVFHIGCAVKHRPEQWVVRCNACDIANAQPRLVNLFLPMHSKRISSELSQGNQVVRGAFHSQQAT